MKITFRDRPLIFIDLEASGLGPASYPIEVGWCSDDEQAPNSFLLRPAPDWPYADFTDAALAVHKIPYERLASDGVSIPAACRRLELAWTGAILVSDNPPADGRWLKRLYQAAGVPYPWKLHDFDVIDAALAIQYGGGYGMLADLRTTLDRLWTIPHRAGDDARRLARIARAIVDPQFRKTLLPS